MFVCRGDNTNEQLYCPGLRREFPNNDACLEWIKEHRWPEGICCTKCQRVTRHHRVKGRRSYECGYCRNHVYPTAGTILRKSTTPLTTWFGIVHRMASTEEATSARQVQREIGVTYKTAWRMCKLIRHALGEHIHAVQAGRGAGQSNVERGSSGKGAVAGSPQGPARARLTRLQFHRMLAKVFSINV